MIDKFCLFLTSKIRKEMPEVDDEKAEVINYGLQLIIGEIPKIFKGYNFITIKLISSNPDQIREQMIYRHNNEGGLYDLDNIVKSNEKSSIVLGRPERFPSRV